MTERSDHGPKPTGRFAAVDVRNDQCREGFHGVVAQLKFLGWTVGGNDGAIGLIDADDYEPPAIDRPSILICRTRSDVERFGAIEPRAFEILNHLGFGRLETELANSVSDDHIVDKVLVGLNWTLVRAGNLCGIARSPSRGTEGARTIRPENGFVGRRLSEIAAYLRSVDPLSRSIGIAAVNAYWNRLEPCNTVKPFIQPAGGLSGIPAPGDGVVIVGGFRGAQKRLTNARIVEREPKPGDISVEDAPKAYGEAEILAITAQTLMNGSLEPILRASPGVPKRMLVGPSCPACPIILDHGIDETYGAVIVDPDAAEAFIVETGTMIMLDHIAQSRCLQRLPVATTN